MRAFIGMDFGNEVNGQIYEIQEKLRKYARKGRWKDIDNLHLTLKFLDEISPTQKIDIDEVMKEISITRRPLYLTISELGFFKGSGSIPVLWLGLEGDIEELHSLHEETDKALSAIGFLPEKRMFKPHITIGQDIIFTCDFNQICEEIGKIQIDTTNINSIFLFKSMQIHNKRVYFKETEYNFSRKA
ncbi:MAG TPA: RNA 2',3'-cyclic phosphodiesterase [Clostridiales bacterium]|nr:RNA 2',3'-cyclic phosphodiesterase [Clostridiales bacterium]